MDTWVWLVIVAVVAVVLFALAWRSAGRAKPRARGSESQLTREQTEQLSLNQIRNRSNPPAPY